MKVQGILLVTLAGIIVDTISYNVPMRNVDKVFESSLKKAARRFILPFSLSILITFTSSSLHIQPVNAATLSASKLYEEAEKGIVVTQKEYKDVENDWVKSKKNIIESSKNLGKSSELIKQLSLDLLDYQSKVNKFRTDYDNGVKQLNPEIEILQLSTSAKFEKAELAQGSQEKLQVIQKLFAEAEKEAKVLNHEMEVLKQLSSSIGTNNLILPDKVQQINVDLKNFLRRADDIQIMQGNGLALLTDGLAKNVNACHYGGPQCSAKDQNGLALFKQGYDVIGSAQNEFQKLTKDLQKDLKDVEYTSNQFAKLSNSLQTLSQSSEAWEKETGLRSNVGKAVVKQSIDDVNKAIESSKKTLVMFAKVDDKILSKESGGSKKNEIVETDKLVKDSLLVTFNKLSKAEQQGRATERLLRDATAQGDKEAKMYLRYSSPIKLTAKPQQPFVTFSKMPGGKDLSK